MKNSMVSKFSKFGAYGDAIEVPGTPKFPPNVKCWYSLKKTEWKDEIRNLDLFCHEKFNGKVIFLKFQIFDPPLTSQESQKRSNAIN
jgi:hypothetical protein